MSRLSVSDEYLSKSNNLDTKKCEECKSFDCQCEIIDKMKKITQDTHETFKMKNMNVDEFIKYIIKFEDVDSILLTCESQSLKGYVFERLWDIIIKLRFCKPFTKPDYINMTGNMNNGKLKELKTSAKYLKEKVISGKSSGCSDISLYNKTTHTYTFITSKYPKSHDDIKNQKSVSYYDIQNIISVVDDNKEIYKDINIYLLVPDKKSLLKKVKKANKSSKYITKHMNEENILDKEDLNKCFTEFKYDILKHMNNSKDGKINYDELYFTPKSNLDLRFHQELIIQKTYNLIKEHKSFLWACKCRSGKTYMVGGLITKLFNINKKINALIITPVPTETSPQFIDLFDNSKEFTEFNIHHIVSSKNIDCLEIKDESSNIFVISKQLLQNFTCDKTCMKIKNLKLDIIVFDENHFSGTTDLSKLILNSYTTENTIKVYLTATYNKPLHEWNIQVDCQMYWDIEDEQICKNILVDNTNINKLKEKHGTLIIDETVKLLKDKKGQTIYDMFKTYKNMPDMYLFTTLFDSERYDIIKENIKDSVYGFCFSVLFCLNKQNTKFMFEKEVRTILRFISGSNKEVDFKDSDKSMFTRIEKTCASKDTRKPFTQLWFLPSNNINEISKCLKQLISLDNILKNYNVLCINRKNTDLAKDIKDDITKHEQIAKSENKEGLILLAGNMLTLGITLNLCDVVMLMNDSISSDKVLQQMYRCMTEGDNKKIGFVIDLSISRVLNTCINHTVYKNDKSLENKLKYIIENHLINIDVDMMEEKKLNSDIIVSKLMKIWKSNPVNGFKILLRNLDNDHVVFDDKDQKELNDTFTISIRKNTHYKVEVKDEGDDLQKLPTGKNKNKDGEDDKDENKKVINISFTKDVLTYVIPLTCILTIKDTNKDFCEMLNYIQENKELLDVFNDMCLIWWNRIDLVGNIKNIVFKYFKKNSNIFNIFITFKMALQSLIDNPKALLELINDCLKPKDIEKNKFGEVFTPMCLINEMLDNLDTHYTKEHSKSIFTEKGLKWFDPASGMGNFPIAVYLRLMDGLKVEIPNTEVRKKHIIENMLYMSELNKKNVFVCNQIFNINNEYKLNIHEGDTLQLDIKKEFGVDKFGVVMGNPPYNKSKDGTLKGGYGGRSLWDKFVVKSLNEFVSENSYLLFIHPPSWRKPEHYLWNVLGKKQLLYLKTLTEENSKKIFGCSTLVDYYVLKNTNSYKETIIDGQDGKTYSINVNEWNFLPSGAFDNIKNILGNNEVLYSSSIYDTRRQYVNIEKKKTENNNLPVVHNMTKKDGLGFVYSTEDKGHFGVSKVILSFGRHQYPYNDFNGEYGMSQICYGLKINSKEEGDKIVDAINSVKFKEILKYTKWSTFQTDWRMFKFIKPDFWKSFIDTDSSLLSKKVSDKNIVEQTEEKKEPCVYKNMNLVELKKLCKDRNIKGYSGKKKDVIIDMLNKLE